MPVYPSTSPLDGVTANLASDWLTVALADPVFSYPLDHPSTSEFAKLRLMQETFWPALARWVESRQEVLATGEVLGGWSRADMYGMMDWYRSCLCKTSRYVDAVQAHADGVWLTVLKTSPWFDWPEFIDVYSTPYVDRRASRHYDVHGRLIRVKRHIYHAKREDEFMDLWERVANARPLTKYPDGSYAMPYNLTIEPVCEFTIFRDATDAAQAAEPGRKRANADVMTPMDAKVKCVPPRTGTPQAAR